jgi:hypothetical protein
MDDMRIIAGFLRTSEGCWVNIKTIRTFYIGGHKDVGFRICLSFEILNEKAGNFGFKHVGYKYDTFDEAQKRLDNLIEELDVDEN